MSGFNIKKFLMENREKSIKIGVIVVICIVVCTVFLFSHSKDDDELKLTDSTAKTSEENAEEKEDVLIVDIAGAVETPMVVELEANSRIQDAIDAAGGLTKDADISQVNRAQILTDGEKIYIPEKGESVTSSTSSSSGASSSSSSETGNTKININTADSEELQEITGVGPATAEKIINYRTSNGNFKQIEDIKNVSGIGDKTFEKMKDEITV